MKFFIYLCCVANLLTLIPARLRLTTPLPSSLRSNDEAAGHDSNIASMIDFINSVYNNDGRSIARSGKYGSVLRRFELPAVQSINLSPNVVVPNNEDTENQLEKQEDAARYHVIDNPEVLEEYSNKQKQKNIARRLTPVISETSAEAKSFSTVENKLLYYHSKSKSTASNRSTDTKKFDRLDHPNPLAGVQELTTVESIYRPSFPDNDDDDKLATEDIEVRVTEKEISTPRTDAKNYGGDTDKRPAINNTVEIEKRSLDKEAPGKGDQARFKEKKLHMDNIRETVQIKKFPLKTDKNIDGVTLNEEKNGSYKEYISTKIDSNSNERLRSEDSARPRDDYSKNYRNKQRNGTTDTNSETDNKPKERSSDTNKINNLQVERLMGRIDKSALRTKQKNNNRDHKEQHSMFSHKERNENSNKRFKHKHEKREEYDRKIKDVNNDGWGKKEKDWDQIDKQRYNKDNKYDRMEYEWNKRHQQYDETDNQWDTNDDFNSRDRDSNKRDNDWKKRDNDWNKRDSDWNKRDIDSYKRDNYWNKRYNDRNKRHNEWIRKETKTPVRGIHDRNKNYWDRKQNYQDNNNSEMSVENDRGEHGRYKIVERKRKDSDYNFHSEV